MKTQRKTKKSMTFLKVIVAVLFTTLLFTPENSNRLLIAGAAIIGIIGTLLLLIIPMFPRIKLPRFAKKIRVTKPEQISETETLLWQQISYQITDKLKAAFPNATWEFIKRPKLNDLLNTLPQYLQESLSLECEKLQMYGMVSNAMVYISGAMITLSESGKNILQIKKVHIKKATEQREKEAEILKNEFISHANKDKSDYVDLLNMSVKRLGINVFYDTDVLSWGDNWKRIILDGTSDSEFVY